MTIAVAIRTGSSVVFAADSKLTTSGVVGLEEDGSPRWVEQTYDNAIKVVHDRSQTVMAMVAGEASIGRIRATDYISRSDLEGFRHSAKQDEDIANLAKHMMEVKREYWTTTTVPPEKWPGPTVLLAAPSPDGTVPRIWRVVLEGADPQISEILTEPGIRLEGSYDEVYCLLYGLDYSVTMALAEALGVERDRMLEAVRAMRALRPIDKLSLWGMPVQDAIDMAVFLAKVQVEMAGFSQVLQPVGAQST